VIRTVLVALALPACALGRPAASAPDTDVSVQDADGSAVIGVVKLQALAQSPPARDTCQHTGSSCPVAVPQGVYLLKFYKMRGGRVGSTQRSGPSVVDRVSGCLLSRVALTPGKAIVCKSNGGFDRCRGTRVHTMNCGDAVVQAWTPRPEEPQDLTDPDDDDDLPSNSGSGGTVKPPVSAEQKQ